MKIENIGGARLGTGGKQSIEVRNFARSTHDLSKAAKTSMAAGVLVPTYFEPAQVGDVWDIDLNSLTRTTPTIGPIFGTFKQQTDVFFCPVRLYNGLLHNNAINIGLDMNQIKFPKFELHPNIYNRRKYFENINTSQISSSSLWAYLGVRGLRVIDDMGDVNQGRVSKEVCGLGPLMYWDIVKNYYCNKQEKVGKFITGVYQLETETTLEFARTELWDYHYLRMVKAASYPNVSYDTIYLYEGTEIQVISPTYNIDFSFKGALPIEETVLIFKNQNNADIIVPLVDVAAADQLILGWYDGTIRINQFKDTYYNYMFKGIAYNGVRKANDTEIKIDEFNLENIDDARYYILQKTEKGRTLYFGTQPLEGYDSFNKKPYNILNELDANGELFTKQKMVGLALKTYQADIFNNWLDTETIDRVNSISRVNIQNSSFTIESLRLAEKTYNMLNRIVLAGGTYEDWLEAVYSEEVPKRVESPIYIGGMSREILFEEVVSTADTADTPAGNQPLGTIAGKGIQSNEKNGGHINFHVSEPGFIMIITSITPRLDYSQGNKFHTEFDSLDDFHKPSLDGIGYQDLLLRRLAWWAESQQDNDPYSPVTELAVGKVPAWSWWMTNYDETFGDFAAGETFDFMANNRSYQVNAPYGNYDANNPIQDLTTYIDPKKSNKVFADTSRGAANFWVQVGQKCIVRRKISAKPIENL